MPKMILFKASKNLHNIINLTEKMLTTGEDWSSWLTGGAVGLTSCSDAMVRGGAVAVVTTVDSATIDVATRLRTTDVGMVAVTIGGEVEGGG